MALTETLNNVQTSGLGIVEPTSAGPSFLGGLARLASRGAALADRFDTQRKADETTAALNDAAAASFKARREAQANLNGSQEPTPQEQAQSDAVFSSYLTDPQGQAIPPEVQDAGARMKKVQTAVKAGALPQSALTLRMEDTVEELFRLHPENKYAIAQYFHNMGLDHYMFRDLTATVAAQDAEVAFRQAQSQSLREIAIKAGLGLPSDDPAELEAKGAKFNYAMSQMKLAKDQLENNKTQLEIDELRRKQIETEANDTIVKSVITDADMSVGSLLNQAGALAIEASKDPQNENAFRQQVPVLAQSLEGRKLQAITFARQHNAGDSAVKAITEWYDNAISGFTRLYTGDLSAIQSNKAVLENMQTQLGITSMQAFPVWYQLSKIPGIGAALPLYFGADPTQHFDPKVKDAIAKELKGFSPGDPSGMMHVYRVAEILRGDLKLSAMTLPEAQRALKSVNTAVVANAKEYNNGDKTNGEAILNGLEQVAEATSTLTSTNDSRPHWISSVMLSDKDTLAALTKMASQPETKEHATNVIIGVRAGAQKGILSIKDGEWSKDPTNGLVELFWDDKSLKVKIRINETNYKNYVDQLTKKGSGSAAMGAGVVAAAGGVAAFPQGLATSGANFPFIKPMSREDILKKGSSVLNERAAAINNYAEVMAGTTQFDPTAPSGVSYADAKRAAFFGKTLDEYVAAKDGKGAKGDTFQQRLDALVQQAVGVQQDTVNTNTLNRNKTQLQDFAFKTADEGGVPRPILDFLLTQESQWNPNIGGTTIDNNKDGKPDSTARGIGQITEPTGRLLGLVGKGFDYRDDPNKAIPAVVKYLKQLYDKTGSWEKALEAYGVTHPSNFKNEKGVLNEQAYNAVIEKARRAIGNG